MSVPVFNAWTTTFTNSGTVQRTIVTPTHPTATAPWVVGKLREDEPSERFVIRAETRTGAIVAVLHAIFVHTAHRLGVTLRSAVGVVAHKWNRVNPLSRGRS